MKLSVGPKKGVWNHKTQFEICEAFKIPLKSLLGQIYYWTSSWRLKRILLGPISYKAATPGPPPTGKSRGRPLTSALGRKRDASAARPWRGQSKASAAPPPLPAPSPPQTSTDAPTSTTDPPPSLPWAASMQRKPPRQWPDPDTSQAKQALLPPPLPAPSPP